MPAAVVYAALGAAGTRLSKFLIVSFVSSLITSGLYLYLGWTIGEPADNAATAPGSASETPREWWEEPGLPWKHKPTRADIACLSWMGVASVYGLILLPLRPVMLGLAPHLLGSLGYRTGLVMTGALGSIGDRWWPLVLVLGSLMAMKFDWIYWWAGKLWGHGLIEVWSGRSERA